MGSNKSTFAAPPTLLRLLVILPIPPHLNILLGDAANIADQITSQRLTLGRGQVAPLEPFLMTLLLPESKRG